MRNACRVALALFCLIFVGSGLIFAQSDLGSISGFVKDPSGATVADAKVLIHNQTGIQRETTTNESGFYTVTNLPPGLYTISVQAPGFQKYQSNDNKLEPSGHLGIDVPLAVGSSNETVEVTATTVALQTESATVQKLVTREQIDALELNGRNPVLMSNLVPGTRGGNLAGLSFNFSQGPANFNGSRNPENLITYHGAAYEYLRNDAFNANTWTRNHTPGQNFVPPFRYNQFGYHISGPLYIPGKFNTSKTRIFWYWGQEWVRFKFTDTRSLTVPSLLMRQGDFSELLNPSNFFFGKTVIII